MYNCGIFWTGWCQSYAGLVSVCHPKCYDLLKYAMTIVIQLCFSEVLELNQQECDIVQCLVISLACPALSYVIINYIYALHKNTGKENSDEERAI